ncbi:MAG: carbohydrate-binding domain-containing protein [Lachnospiraceae bacterium]|nr:carbohydrate-binding domain-containing protein [Lachnospiraceae bacterium]
MKKMNRIKITKLLAVLLGAVLLLSACSTGGQSSTAAQEGTASGTAVQGNTNPATQPDPASQSTAESTHAADPEESRGENSGSLSVITAAADGFTQAGDVYTVTKAGTYTFSGTSAQGQIVVDAKDQKVEIILSGVTLSNGEDAPVKALAADKLTITAAEGSYNEITDLRALRSSEEVGETAEAEEKAAGGAVYAKCDLTLAGTGTLVVTGGYNNGVHTTKDLKVKDLTLKVTAPNNAVKGNDSVTVSSGSLLLISTGGDGIKTDDSDVSSKGNQRGTVTISGGVIDIYAACDGIDAAYNVEIAKGEPVIHIYTDSYSPYTGEIVSSSTVKAYVIVKPELYKAYSLFAAYFYNEDRNNGVWAPAAFEMNCYSGRTTYNALSYSVPSGYENVAFFVFSGSTASLSEYAAATTGGAVNSGMNAFLINSISGSTISGDYVSLSVTGGDSVSAKGIKADNEILIAGGTLTIESKDDAIHANSDVVLGSGVNGTGNVTVSDGSLSLTSGDDGIHADNIVTFDGGSVNVLSAYEGVEGNQVIVNGGTVCIYATDDGVNACAGAASPLVQVNGGYLQVTTRSGDTDGIDSNGSYVQTGGFVLIMGGSSQGMVAGSLDVDGSVTVTGGTVVALGGICETPGGSNNCCMVGLSGQSFSAGEYTVTDGSRTLISFTLSGNYSNGWIASDTFSQGGSYSLKRDGSSIYNWTQSGQSAGSGGSGSKGGQGGWGPGGGRK